MKQESFSAADCMQQCGSPSARGIFFIIEINSYYTATAISANSLQTLTTVLLHCCTNYVIGILISETAPDTVAFQSGGSERIVKNLLQWTIFPLPAHPLLQSQIHYLRVQHAFSNTGHHKNTFCVVQTTSRDRENIYGWNKK